MMGFLFSGGISSVASQSASDGGGGGTSFHEIVMSVADLTDGTWTLFDPDNTIDTNYGTNGVTYSSGFNTVQWNAVSSNSDKNWNSSGNLRAPRWYKLLKISNNQITTGSHFSSTIRLESDDSINDFNRILVAGPAIDPTATVDTSILGTGAIFLKTTTGNQTYGSWTVNNSTRSSSSSIEYCKAVAHWGGDSSGSVQHIVYDSSDAAVNSNGRNTNRNSLTGNLTTNIYLMIGIGPGGNTISVSAGDQQKFKVSFLNISTAVP